ncbi:MAG: bifunctional metallophosphatase/5'-nucleotidase [Bacteroides sp.]|nr:bifunctional metallophosphatase/5'-nucleotidase [Bacteroides sp.]
MKRILFLGVWMLLLAGAVVAQTREVTLKFVETSDIHGNYFPYNFIQKREWGGSLARVYSLVEKERERYGDNLILIDNGDILQGQPTAYYYNFIDTVSPHLCAEILNYMRYDAAVLGNHDIETGLSVYKRWMGDCNFPVLGANISYRDIGENFALPYIILEREGVKIAILGMITPAIPVWLSENLWQGLYFEDMEKAAAKWMEVIREKEQPDVVVGSFHAGVEPVVLGGHYRDNASLEVATRVPGFDIVMTGHDHRRLCEKIVNVRGDSVLVINPANNGVVVGDIEVKLTLTDGRVTAKSVEGKLTPVADYGVSEAFMERFGREYATVKEFFSRKIGSFTETVTTRPAYFGPSAFIDFIHTIQLDLSGADISFAAPLSFNATIEKGDITVSDMFNLYRYENMLYVMNLSGREVRGFLEESYANWTNRMRSEGDHILLLKERREEGDGERATFRYPSYNFDSAAGIIYTVDVTKPAGEKITILSMADGSPFSPDRVYKVALNSYRGNGGGDLLTKGAGIPQEELTSRIVYSSDKDLRYYMMSYIEEKGTLDPQPLNQWKFIPEEWVEKASRRDYIYLFGEE